MEFVKINRISVGRFSGRAVSQWQGPAKSFSVNRKTHVRRHVSGKQYSVRRFVQRAFVPVGKRKKKYYTIVLTDRSIMRFKLDLKPPVYQRRYYHGRKNMMLYDLTRDKNVHFLFIVGYTVGILCTRSVHNLLVDVIANRARRRTQFYCSE